MKHPMRSVEVHVNIMHWKYGIPVMEESTILHVTTNPNLASARKVKQQVGDAICTLLSIRAVGDKNG